MQRHKPFDALMLTRGNILTCAQLCQLQYNTCSILALLLINCIVYTVYTVRTISADFIVTDDANAKLNVTKILVK